MRIAAEAWLLAKQRFAENKAIITFLTASDGLLKGLCYEGRENPQPGDLILARWHARLVEHLGQAKIEVLKRASWRFLDEPAKLAALSSASDLLANLLPPCVPNPKAFGDYRNLLAGLKEENWVRDYVCWELELLGDVGYGLDLSRCAVSGVEEDLAYVSPKSGRAAGRKAAEPYADKLLRLPKFLREYARHHRKEAIEGASKGELWDGLQLTGHFLQMALHGKAVPGRSVLLQLL